MKKVLLIIIATCLLITPLAAGPIYDYCTNVLGVDSYFCEYAEYCFDTNQTYMLPPGFYVQLAYPNIDMSYWVVCMEVLPYAGADVCAGYAIAGMNGGAVPVPLDYYYDLMNGSDPFATCMENCTESKINAGMDPISAHEYCVDFCSGGGSQPPPCCF